MQDLNFGSFSISQLFSQNTFVGVELCCVENVEFMKFGNVNPYCILFFYNLDQVDKTL
jgi:hypothetical protein